MNINRYFHNYRLCDVQCIIFDKAEGIHSYK